MKNKLPKALVLCTFLLGMMLGSFFNFRGCIGSPPYAAVRESDTTRSIRMDTLAQLEPMACETLALESQIFTLPLTRIGAGAGGIAQCTVTNDSGYVAPVKRLTTIGTGAGGEPRQRFDSAAVEVPITQLHYTDPMYDVWVSGFAQRMDSIKIYPRTETITIREYKPPNPKRWHIGPTIGVGVTTHGIEPFIGISVTYSLISL